MKRERKREENRRERSNCLRNLRVRFAVFLEKHGIRRHDVSPAIKLIGQFPIASLVNVIAAERDYYRGA